MTDIERLLIGRQILNAYKKPSFTKVQKQLVYQLSDLGFNTAKEFIKFNDQMCIDEIKRCIVLVGECDLCKGRREVPACVAPNGDCGWYNQKSENGTKPIQYPRAKMYYDIPMSEPEFFTAPMPKVGAVVPVLIGCSISSKMIAEYRFDVRWLPPKEK